MIGEEKALPFLSQIRTFNDAVRVLILERWLKREPGDTSSKSRCPGSYVVATESFVIPDGT